MTTSLRKPYILPALISGLSLLLAGRVAAQTFTTLHSFSYRDGDYGGVPWGGVILSGNTLYGTTYVGGTNGVGSVFAVNTNGTSYTILYSFGMDGSEPRAGLVLSGNTLYGTTFGPYSDAPDGTVFKINTDGTGFTNLHTFNILTEGSAPYGEVSLVGDTLYGTTWEGGTANSGTVYAVNTDGSGFRTLYGLGTPLGGLVLSSNTLYGTEQNDDLFKISTDGTNYGVIHYFAAPGQGAGPDSTLVLSGNTLFGTAGSDNAKLDWGTVFSLNINGADFRTLHSFTPGIWNETTGTYSNSDGAFAIKGVIVSGNTLYGTTQEGGTNGNGTIFVLNTDGTGFTVLHTFTAVDSNTHSNSDGAYPFGILMLSGNTLYGTTEAGGSSGWGTVFSLSLEAASTAQGSLQVTITPAAAVSAGAQWQVDGGTFQGSGATVTNLPATDVTVSFKTISGWATAPNQTATIIAGQTTTLAATYLDTTKPTLSIVSPKAGLTVSNAVFTVTGAASDNWQVTNVFYSLNSGGWSNAVTANNWSNWTAAVTLIPGTNTIAAYSVDPDGDVSSTTNVSLFFVVTNQLRIRAIGLGTVSPNYSNAWLHIGQNYPIIATARPGFDFSNWTISTNWIGGRITNNAAVQFMMESNLTLQVRFAETSKPTLTITSPTNAQKMTNALAHVEGTARDNWGVGAVWYQLNGGAWDPAITSNGWTNWSMTLPLRSGTNTVRAYAVDLGGNPSITNTVSVTSSNTFDLRLSIAPTNPLPSNGLGFKLELSRGINGTIQVSSNLVNWTVLTNFVGTNESLNFRDSAASNFQQRFYRAVTQ